MIATLKQITPKEVNLNGKLADSVSVIRRNLAEIKS